MLVVTAAACGSSSNKSSKGATPTTSGSSTDKAAVNPDAVVKIGWVGPADTVDPQQLKATATQPYVYLLYDRLTRIDENLKVQPMLAKSWDFAPGGTYIDFHLRDDVKFHDGTPVDAAAVKATLERGQTLKGSSVAGVLKPISSIDVVDPTTVRLHVSSGGAQLPAVLSTNAGAIISPKAISDGRNLGTAPGDAGSGPYLLTKISPPDSASFERAPGHYWDTRTSGAKGYDIQYITDFSARLNALKSGQLDFTSASGLDQVQATELGKQHGFASRTVDTTTTFVILLRNNKAPFDNPDLRQALNLGVDRNGLANDFLQGFCTPTNQPYGPGNSLHNDSLPIEHNTKKAKSLVTSSGTKSLNMITVASSTFQPPAQVLQSQLGSVGLDVTVTPLPTSSLFSDWAQGQGDMFFVGILGYPTPYQLLHDSYLGGFFDGGTVPKADTAKVEDLASQAVSLSADASTQNAAYKQIFDDSTKNNWIIPLCTQKTSFVYTDKVVGVADMDGQSNSIPDFRTLGLSR